MQLRDSDEKRLGRPENMFIRSLPQMAVTVIFFSLIGLSSFSGIALAQQRRALILGDSHVAGPMGIALQSRLRQMGFIVERSGQSGRNPSNFTGLDSLIDGHRNSELAIAEFGDNMANYRGPFSADQVRAEMNRLMSAFRRAGRLSPERCIIVSPTYGETGPINGVDYRKTDARLAELIETMRETVGNNCTFIDSRTLPEMESGAVRTTDSLHLTPQWGAVWAAGIIGQIAIPERAASRAPSPRPQTSASAMPQSATQPNPVGRAATTAAPTRPAPESGSFLLRNLPSDLIDQLQQPQSEDNRSRPAR